MSLTPGSRIGHYEVLALLGAGGMGEVYRYSEARIGGRSTVTLPMMYRPTVVDSSVSSRSSRSASWTTWTLFSTGPMSCSSSHQPNDG